MQLTAWREAQQQHDEDVSQWGVPGLINDHGLILILAGEPQLLSPAPGAAAPCGAAPCSAHPASASASHSTPLCAAVKSCVNRKKSRK